MENWKQIKQYPKYEISSLGRVRHVKYKKIRKTRLNSNGYEIVTLQNDTTKVFQTPRIHRLVAAAFIGIKPNSVVDHINRVRSDNRLINLRIATFKENNLNKDPLTTVKVRQIISLHEQGMTPRQILEII